MSRCMHTRPLGQPCDKCGEGMDLAPGTRLVNGHLYVQRPRSKERHATDECPACNLGGEGP